MKLIVTRPEEDAARLSARLEAMGHRVFLAPVISISPIRGVEIPDRSYQAVAVSSANAARNLPGGAARERVLALPCYTTGRQSAAAATRAGFQHVAAAGGDVAHLARLMASVLDRLKGPVLYLSGKETAGDLAGDLAARGLEVERVVLYEAVAATTLPREVRFALQEGTADGVLIYSPRSARVWTALLETEGLSAAGRRLRHYCLSPNVAAALGSDYVTLTADHPDEDALLSLLDPGR